MIRSLTPARKRKRTLARKARVVPALPRPHQEPPKRRGGVVNGIRYVWSASEQRMKEFCETREAISLRRLEIFGKANFRCERCGVLLAIFPSSIREAHWHHKQHRSLGGDDSLANGECLCRDCHRKEHHG